MVVIWGNILSFIGNVFALAVEVLVFNAFFPRNENRKSQWLCILLWWAIATFLSISVGTKFGYTLTMLQEVALIYLFCAFLYQSRWDRRLFIQTRTVDVHIAKLRKKLDLGPEDLKTVTRQGYALST